MHNSKFKTPQGRRLTQGLFYETTLADKSTVVYTLKEQDHEGYPSLKRLYLECGDPTEHRFATSYLDGWSHWEMLIAAEWFQPHVSQWRKELELKIKSAALFQIQEEATNDLSKSKFAANKFLLEGGWKPKGETQASRRGRPSKQEVMDEARKMAEERDLVEDAFRRVVN